MNVEFKPLEEFYLLRTEDASGVSGEGVVARGMVLETGQCVLYWRTFFSSISIYQSLTELTQIHSHGGKTQVIMGCPGNEKKTKRKTKGE